LISEERIKEIINQSNLSDVEQLEVIRCYIHDIKGVDVGVINRVKGDLCMSVFPPVIDYELLMIAYDVALGYYSNKFKI